MLTGNNEVDAALIGAVVGGILGVLLVELKDFFWRMLRRKAHWRALGAEIELCREMAEIFLNDTVKAPLYRLPTLSYLNSFPALLADGAPNGAETKAITQFYCQVETLNRGFDQANEARGNESALNDEYVRNGLKAEKLVPSASYYAQVRASLDLRIGKVKANDSTQHCS